jgi:membrane complex biogenesis BtpA family protein
MEAPNTPLTRADWSDWLAVPLFGVVHLPALLGAPRYAGDPNLAQQSAERSVERLVEVGFGAVMVENFGDAPFHAARIETVTVAAMARCVAALRARWPTLRIGVNCLRNDARSALAIAAACGADAIRVNVHCGAAWSDQGLLRGQAARTLRLRAQLGPQIKILADVQVKHARPAGGRSLLEEAVELRERGLADAILITGAATGKVADPQEFRGLRDLLPTTPLLVASGVDANNAAQWAKLADGALVGSSLMLGGRAGTEIDAARAQQVFLAYSGKKAAQAAG